MRVLLTGAGAPGGPGIIKAIQQDKSIQLIVCDADANASGRFLNDKFYKIPNAESENFVDELFRICLKEKIDLIFPLVTRELFVLSKLKKEFSQIGTEILVSEIHNLEIANNKSQLCLHLRKKGIVTPNFFVAETIEELEKAFIELGYPEKPVCVKPSLSNGSRGVRIVDKSINEFDLLFNYKPNNLYINHDKLMDILKSKKFPELLVSEYLPGEEYTVDTIVSEGKAQLIIPRIRIKMNGGISVAGEFIYNKDVIEYSRLIVESLSLDGPIGVQAKRGSDGIFKVLEINPRIQGTSVAALGLGVNLPLLSIYSYFNLAEIPNSDSLPWGTKFARYYSEVFYE